MNSPEKCERKTAKGHLGHLMPTTTAQTAPPAWQATHAPKIRQQPSTGQQVPQLPLKPKCPQRATKAQVRRRGHLGALCPTDFLYQQNRNTTGHKVPLVPPINKHPNQPHIDTSQSKNSRYTCALKRLLNTVQGH